VVLGKKLVTASHTDNSLLSNNLWAANTTFARTAGQSVDKMLNKFTYYPLMGSSSLTNDKDVFAGYKWMEYGFFWYTKRFYLNNTLRANQITSLPVYKDLSSQDRSLDQAETSTVTWLLNTTTALRALSFTNKEFNFLHTQANLNYYSGTTSTLSDLEKVKDVTLFYKHNDLFDNDNLRMLVNVSSIWTSKASRVWSFSTRQLNNK